MLTMRTLRKATVVAGLLLAMQASLDLARATNCCGMGEDPCDPNCRAGTTPCCGCGGMSSQCVCCVANFTCKKHDDDVTGTAVCEDGA